MNRYPIITTVLFVVCGGCSQSDQLDQGASIRTDPYESVSTNLATDTSVEHRASDSLPLFGDYSDISTDENNSESFGGSDMYDSYAAEQERQRIADAKRAVVDAQYDLNRSVRSLSNGDWENDLPNVQRRLRALESANFDLSSVDSAAAADMDWEISRMKREVRRLEDENWRDVVPDIEQRNRSIGWESDNIVSSIEE